MSLKVSTEPKEHRLLEMTIEVSQDRVDQELRKAARKLAGQLRIPGFRQGRAPYHVVVRHVGMGALFEEFVDDLGQEVYREAIEEHEIEPYAVASLDNIELEPLRYTLTIPLPPEVTLGDYRSLRVEEPEIEIDETQVQARIDEIMERQSGYAEVERPSDYGDLMTIDVRALVLDEEGAETDTIVLDETDWDVTPDQENPMEPAGFDEQLVGMTPGEEKQFDIAWPEDSPSMYAGKNVRFHVTVHKLQTYQQPELTDEIAQSVGDYATAEDLIESIRSSVQEEESQEAENTYLEKVLDQLVAISDLTYPPAAVEIQIDNMMRNTDTQLRQMGLQGIEQYLQLIGQSAEEYRQSQREQAERNLRRSLALGKVAEAEQIKVTDAEFDARLTEIFGPEAEDITEEQQQSRRDMFEMMRNPSNRGIIEEQIISEKTVERILAIARGEEVPEPGTETETEVTTEAEVTAESDEADGGSAEEVDTEPPAPVAEVGEDSEPRES